MFCRQCGNEIPNTAAFCPKCGTRTSNPTIQTTTTNIIPPNTTPSTGMPPSPKKKSKVGIIIIVIILLLAVAAGTFYFLYTKNPAFKCRIDGHVWVEANYQFPTVCSTCHITEGQPLTADFETYGFSCITDINKGYDYLTTCYENKNYTTVGTIYLSYKTITSDNTHPALEGYEWKIVNADIVFRDNNAWNYGMSISTCYEDYYNIRLHDDTLINNTDGSTSYTVNWNGIDYTECIRMSSATWKGWTNDLTNTYSMEWAFRVPCGYDGTVVGFRNSGVEWPNGKYIYDVADENTIFFRIK